MWILLVASSCFAAACVDDVDRSIKAIQNIDFTHEATFDRHGNPREEFIDVMLAREDAAVPLVRELARVWEVHDDTAKHQRHAYLYLLGAIKVPSTCDWLREHLVSDGREVELRAWLRGWNQDALLPSAVRSHVIGNADVWLPLFASALERCTDEKLEELLVYTVTTSLWTERSARFVAAYQQKTDDPRLTLALASYLGKMNHSVSSKQVQKAVELLSSKIDGVESVTFYAATIPDKWLIEWLIARVDAIGDPAESALKRITFQFDRRGAAAWREWFEQNSSRSREEWLEESGERFLSMLGDDSRSAINVFDGSYIAWSDPVAITYVERFVKNGLCSESIYSWASVSYTPFYADRFQGFSKSALAECQPQLDPERLRHLTIGAPLDWEEYVQRMTSRK